MNTFAQHKLNNLPCALTSEQWRDAVTLVHTGATFSTAKSPAKARRFGVPLGTFLAYKSALQAGEPESVVGEFSHIARTCCVYSAPFGTHDALQIWEFETLIKEVGK